MFGNPENSVLLNIKTKKNHDFFWKFWKKKKNWEIFQDLSVVRESRKFSNPEREYRIPENPIPGLFGNTEFRKCSIPELQDSRSKKIREWPLVWTSVLWKDFHVVSKKITKNGQKMAIYDS